MRFILFLVTLLLSVSLTAQPVRYTIANTHSHNDYEQSIPFWLAYKAGFASIEADIWLKGGGLLVGHDTAEIKARRTLEAYYLQPLLKCVRENHGHPYADTSRSLQLLIDLKTDSMATLDALVGVLQQYPELINSTQIKFTMTGNRPSPALWQHYPAFISFDGELARDYDAAALGRIVMMSESFRDYSHWNGKGIIPSAERARLEAAVSKSHKLGKPVRFWAAPDFLNAWEQLMKLGVDYLNTDHIADLTDFLNHLGQSSFTAVPGDTYALYHPTYRTDRMDKPVKHVILLIGDGMGLAQLYTGYTANKGALNIFSMRSIGLSKTSSADSYVTDSAPGSTAFSSGQKTNNRYVGADTSGKALALLPALLARRKIRTGLVTCGDIADATPADFYAHQKERDNAAAILQDLKGAPIDVLMGSGDESLNNVAILKESSSSSFGQNMLQTLQPEYTIVHTVDSVQAGTAHKYIVVESRAGLSMLKGRGPWLQKAFNRTLDVLSGNPGGFFIMTEGAQVDYGGHANNLSYVAMEMMDFDQVVGKALQFADKDGETLVIVTADHETGGLSLLDGDYRKGSIQGNFASNDHTGIPVPVFAYGPRSGSFCGVYENTAIFSKILAAYGGGPL